MTGPRRHGAAQLDLARVYVVRSQAMASLAERRAEVARASVVVGRHMA